MLDTFKRRTSDEWSVNNVYLFIFFFSVRILSLKITSIKIYAFKNFIEFLLLLVVVFCSLEMDWFSSQSYFHVEAIYSLICCSFISYAKNAVSGFIFFPAILASLLTLLSDVFCAYFEYAQLGERKGNYKLSH